MLFEQIDFLELLGDDPDQAIQLYEKIKETMSVESPFSEIDGVTIFKTLFHRIKNSQEISDVFLNDIRLKLILFSVSNLISIMTDIDNFLDIDPRDKKIILNREVQKHGNFYVYYTKKNIDLQKLSQQIFLSKKKVGIPIRI